MAYESTHYREQLKALLPPGRAFPRERGSTLDALLDALAQELARVDVRSDELSRDAVPSLTAELLPDWERVAGLPDNCSGLLAETIQARRADLVSKLTSRGGQSPAYFIEVAAALGYDVTIEEFRPFRAGMSVAGDALTNGDWVFAWRIIAPEETIRYFLAGQSAAGEPLADWGNAALECRLRKIAPAHTIPIFAYETVMEGALLLESEEGALLVEDGSGALTLE